MHAILFSFLFLIINQECYIQIYVSYEHIYITIYSDIEKGTEYEVIANKKSPKFFDSNDLRRYSIRFINLPSNYIKLFFVV
jgi:hypothetical protein